MRCRWGFGLWIDTVMGWDFLGNVGMWWVYFACGKDMKLWNQRVGFISSPLEPMSCYLLWIKMLKMWIGYGSWDGGFFFFLWSQWTLNAITRVLSEWDERRSDRRGEGSVTTEVEIGVIQPQTNERQQSPENGEHSPHNLRREGSLVGVLILAQWYQVWIFCLQNCERIKFCCLKLRVG